VVEAAQHGADAGPPGADVIDGAHRQQQDQAEAVDGHRHRLGGLLAAEDDQRARPDHGENSADRM